MVESLSVLQSNCAYQANSGIKAKFFPLPNELIKMKLKVHKYIKLLFCNDTSREENKMLPLIDFY